MTSKEQLKALVDGLPEEQAAELLRVVTNLVAVPEQWEPLPAFVGIADSGRSDLSTNVDNLLAEGFGR